MYLYHFLHPPKVVASISLLTACSAYYSEQFCQEDTGDLYKLKVSAMHSWRARLARTCSGLLLILVLHKFLSSLLQSLYIFYILINLSNKQHYSFSFSF